MLRTFCDAQEGLQTKSVHRPEARTCGCSLEGQCTLGQLGSHTPREHFFIHGNRPLKGTLRWTVSSRSVHTMLN